MSEYLVLEDDLLNLYLDFKHGQRCNARNICHLLSFYKTHLTNYGQYRRINRRMSRTFRAQLVSSGATDNLSLQDLAKKTKLKIILSDSQTIFPYVEIHGNDEMELNFSGAFANTSRNKCMDHLKALCENATDVEIYDSYLCTNRNISLLSNVCSLLGTSYKNVSLYVSNSSPSASSNCTQCQLNFSNWITTNASRFPNLNINPTMVVLTPPNDFHDRYIKLKTPTGDMEILLSSGFDHLLNGTKDFTYVVRTL